LTVWRRPYRTADGYICIVPYSDQHWFRFFTEAGRSSLLEDERFKGIAARTRNIDALYAELASAVSLRSTADWLATCERLDIPVAPYNRLADLERDPQLAQTAFFTTMADPTMGDIVTPAAPLKFDGVAAQPTLPPRLGQHTVEILQQAGLPGPQIEKLLSSGAIIQSAI
jgi:crotonobetainyl-CoA:carnitine CoA-transferase CaiB-like acyl-CoA transferase